MDKMLIDSLGDITITNDGATILDEVETEHPTVKMMVEVAKTQDDMVGDGTTTAVVLASELLKRAEALLDQNVHPLIIVSGYRKATQKALKLLDKLGTTVNIEDRDTLRKVALTSMGSKAVGDARETLADIAIDAVKKIAEKRGARWIADIDNVQITKKEGKSLFDSKLVNGIIVDKEIVHDGMPRTVRNAKIALLDCPIEIEKTEFSAEIRIKDPSQIQAFLDQETRMIEDMVKKITASGANVLLCQKGIDDLAQHYLAKHGILATRRIKQSDMEKLAKATGGKIINNLEDLRKKDLGKAGHVEERKVGDDKMIFVEKCRNPHAVAVLIRAGLERMVDEAERAMNDALCVVSDVIEKNKIVPGGGAIEVEIAKQVREYAPSIGGREQLAIEAFADSMEIVPKTLAENAGLDKIDIMVELRAAHEKPRGYTMGVDVFKGKIANMKRLGVIEPLAVKEQAIKSAAEASSMILRIDDVIAATKPKDEKGPGGMPEDMD
jgi:thermosome